MTDELGRPLITDDQLQRIRKAFDAIPEGKTGAVLVIADTETNAVRAQLAVRLDGRWRVAGGAGWVLAEKRPSGWLSIEMVW